MHSLRGIEINGRKGGRPHPKPNGLVLVEKKPIGLLCAKTENEKPIGLLCAKTENEKPMGPKEKEKEIEKDKEKECVCSTHEHTLFLPLSLSDVISFTKEGLTAMDPGRFYDFNPSVGWTIQDRKAAARL